MYYVEQAASMPMIVGTHYFQYLDQPVTGRFDIENYLFGFQSTRYSYRHMINFARKTIRIYLIHQGEISPLNYSLSLLRKLIDNPTIMIKLYHSQSLKSIIILLFFLMQK